MDFLHHLMEATPSSELLLRLIHVYGIHLVVLCLSAMTFYRREMSCNHCYAEQEQDDSDGGGGAEGERRMFESPQRETECWDEVHTEELLESVGLYCSGASLLPAMLQILEQCRWKKLLLLSSPDHSVDDRALSLSAGMTSTNACNSRSGLKRNRSTAAAPLNCFDLLNVDTQVNVLSFLCPQDIVAFECASKTCQVIVREEALWKTLWHRDYAWILRDWRVGRKAALRSGRTSPNRFDKDFYVRFQLCWQNYVLAGENTFDSCLVGLGGHIFDMSCFLGSHPGSPETVMVHAGKDATDFFMGIRHSSGARRLAQSLCVVVDMSRTSDDIASQGCCGLRPTAHTAMFYGVSGFPDTVAPIADCLLNPRRSGLLHSVRKRFLRDETIAKEAARRFSHLSISGETNVYFDPLLNCWKAWYTGRDLQVVFVDEP